jgi:putative transcriptional regulator
MTTLPIEKSMLRWKLREIMARKRITNRELAELIGNHETSISRLKNQDTMPRIDGETLESLCRALQCTPNDLLEYIPDTV